MQPNNSNEAAREAAERQSNYLILSTLQQKLSPDLFQQILTEIRGSMKLPGRLSWEGQQTDSTFQDLKISQSHLNGGFLTGILQSVNDLRKQSQAKETQIQTAKNLKTLLKQNSQKQNIYRTSLFARLHSHFGKTNADVQRAVDFDQFARFKRMKTIFCHADHSTDEVSSIFNVQFDRTGKLIVSGADDGILKVWDRDTMTLQASLHGHADFIIDIGISKCNRFIASSGKDAMVIIWDLKMGKIVKRLNDHQQQINRVIFVSPKHKAQQNQAPQSTKFPSYSVLKDVNQPTYQNTGPDTTVVKSQFLLTCSDDGTVILYDFSPFSREQKGDSQSQKSKGSKATEYDEFKVRRSGRRGQTDSGNTNQGAQVQSSQEILDIFKVQLTPDDYRPGMRNKKLDTIVCSSQGVVIAGTSSGEVFAWKLNFNEIAKKNAHNCSQFLGQFKIYKNAGVQFAEFSPSADLLLLGSTDGIVKIYTIEIPSSKSKEQQAALKAFNMNDSSRLEISIDEKNGCFKTESITYFDTELEEEKIDYDQVKQQVTGQIGFGKQKEIKFTKSQCDAVKWSVNGRFAIASITSQIEDNNIVLQEAEDNKEEICRIKIWDTINETFHDDLARPSGCQLKKNSWVLAPHPIIEELLMTGSDGGSLILWNIETKQILNKFLQYGVYSIDGYVMDNPLDGKFSVDGKAFVCGNQLGTISLFSCENVSSQYEATRVQQFFMFDGSRDTNNPFEKIENKPQICGYNMIPYEVQPTRSLIGRFTDAQTIQDTQQIALTEDKEINTEEKQEIDNKIRDKIEQSRLFEAKQAIAKELGIMEEKYYKDQIESRIRESYQPFVLEEGRGRIESFHESSIEVNADGDGMLRGYSGMYNEEQSLVNALSPQSPLRPQRESVLIEESPISQNRRLRAQQSGQRRQIGEEQRQGRRRLQRASAALQDNSEVEYQSNDAMEVEANSASAFSQDQSSSSVSLEDEEEPQQRRFEVRRQNMHDTARLRNQEMEEEQREERAARAARRNQGRQPDDSIQDDDGGRRTGRSGRILRRPNYTEQSPGASLQNSPELGTLTSRRSRGRPSNAELQRRNRDDRHQGRSQERPSRRAATEQMHSQANGFGSSSRSRRNQRVLQDSSHESNDRGGIRSTRQNLRQLVDNSASSRHEEEHKSGHKQGFDSHNQMIRECGNFLSDREESTAYNFNTEQQIIESESSEEKRLSKPMIDTKPSQPDEDYEQILNLEDIKDILPADFDPSDKKCTLCGRKDEPIVGPFCKFKDEKRSALVGRPLYFHQDCIEINQYSSFNTSLKKWVNISTMLDNLVHKSSHYCYRCKTKGASIQCFQCRKQFHGFKCAKLYTICFAGSEGEPSSYQCMFCVNEKNYEDKVFQGTPKKEPGLVRSNEYLNYLKDNIQKKHILASKNHVQLEQANKKAFTYSPQAFDLVYYFFQGHEEYMLQYSCHFFSGQTEKFPKKRTMPWTRHKQLLKKEFVLCRIDTIETLFPSERSINLMKLYPDSTSVTQVPQLVQRLYLSVVQHGLSSDKGTIRFTVDIFPNALPDFLIQQTLFEKKYEKYLELVELGSLVGKTVSVLNKSSNCIQMKRVIDDCSPYEPTIHPKSLWLNIKVVDTSSSRGGIGRVTEMPQHRSSRRRDQTSIQAEILEQDATRINFWEIQFGDEVNAIIKQMQIFQPEERAKLVNVLNEFCEKQQEFIIPFLDRVPLDVAPDYRSIIAGEMYFNLIRNRIENGYYRSQASLLSDIDLISYNAKIYNGDDHNIHVSAKNLCEKLRVKLCTSMFMKGDQRHQQQNIANSAKLLPLSKLKTSKKQEEVSNPKEEQKEPTSQKIGLVEEDKCEQAEVTPSDSGKKTAEPAQLTTTRSTRRAASNQRENEEEKTNQPTENGTNKEIVIEIETKAKPQAEGSGLVKIQVKNKPNTDSSNQDKQRVQSSERIGRRRGRQAAGGMLTYEIEEKTLNEVAQEKESNAQSDAVSANAQSDQSAAKSGIKKKLRKRQKVE